MRSHLQNEHLDCHLAIPLQLMKRKRAISRLVQLREGTQAYPMARWFLLQGVCCRSHALTTVMQLALCVFPRMGHATSNSLVISKIQNPAHPEQQLHKKALSSADWGAYTVCARHGPYVTVGSQCNGWWEYSVC